jgi:hypothetical protein
MIEIAELRDEYVLLFPRLMITAMVEFDLHVPVLSEHHDDNSEHLHSFCNALMRSSGQL